MKLQLFVIAGWTFCALVATGQVRAAVPATLYAPANCARQTTAPLNYVFCDDGVPASGGTTANATGALAVTVPAAYGGDGYTGLPAIAANAATVAGADASGYIALDVDVSLPLAPPPAGGYPLLVLMHGCCSGDKTSWEAASFDAAGEQWHYNNAWFASRGYVTVTYTARGFVNKQNMAFPSGQGSTGETALDSRKYEINDYQHLACQVYANAAHWNTATGNSVAINPQAVVVTGGSYGGGFSWLALTDPVWTCTDDTGAGGTQMKLAAAAPRYGWTDLLNSLVPTGRHSASPSSLPDPTGCDSGPTHPDGSACASPVPVGIPKQSIVAALYASGLVGTTFPQELTDAFTCLESAYPPDSNPLCNGTGAMTDVLGGTLPEFLADRSAYYQQSFFDKIATDASYRIPVFNAGTLTDSLFPPTENHQMENRLKQAAGGSYPIQSYYGDYEHFTQNKAKEWGDICGTDHHVCNNADYAGAGFNAAPAGLLRSGVTSRLNRFIDHYAQPPSNPGQAAPAFDVTASLQVCPQKAGASQPADEPGDTFTAASFEQLADSTLALDSAGNFPAVGTATTLSSVVPAAQFADPVSNTEAPSPPASGPCLVRSSTNPVPPGVAVFESGMLLADATMIGPTRLTVKFTPSGDSASVQLNARLFELLASGDALLADRGEFRLSSADVAAGQVSYELYGNAWRFSAGDKIHLELAQDDTPYLKASNPPSSLAITGVTATMPIRTAGGSSSGSSSGGSSGGSSSGGSSSGGSSGGSSGSSGGGGGGGAFGFDVLAALAIMHRLRRASPGRRARG